tara:strand:- start:293 stop:454 length:162 start_codon:yes stop_codon:yes gene_type:complete
MKHLSLTNQQFNFLRFAFEEYEYEEDESEMYYQVLDHFYLAKFQKQSGGNDNE